MTFSRVRHLQRKVLFTDYAESGTPTLFPSDRVATLPQSRLPPHRHDHSSDVASLCVGLELDPPCQYAKSFARIVRFTVVE